MEKLLLLKSQIQSSCPVLLCKMILEKFCRIYIATPVLDYFFLKKFRLLDENSFLMGHLQVTFSSKYLPEELLKNFFEIPKKTPLKSYYFNPVADSRPETLVNYDLNKNATKSVQHT